MKKGSIKYFFSRYLKRATKDFFIYWLIVTVINQVVFFGACLQPYCLLASIPHCSIIALGLVYMAYYGQWDKFNSDGFNCFGYDAEGFSEKGFDISGYNKSGLDIDGFNREGLDIAGFNRRGYDENGKDRLGHSKFKGRIINIFSSKNYFEIMGRWNRSRTNINRSIANLTLSANAFQESMNKLEEVKGSINNDTSENYSEEEGQAFYLFKKLEVAEDIDSENYHDEFSECNLCDATEHESNLVLEVIQADEKVEITYDEDYLYNTEAEVLDVIKLSLSELELIEELNLFDIRSNVFGKVISNITWMNVIWEWANQLRVEPSNVPRSELELLRLDHLSFMSLNYMDRERFTVLPKEFGKLKYLEFLELGDVLNPELKLNHLQRLPNEICDLENLRFLYIQRNSLRSLPKDIGRLQNLEELKLGGNDLVGLPSGIGRLNNLKILTLWGNKVRELPSQLGSLSGLQGLDISGNLITKLPEEIANLTALKKLYFDCDEVYLSDSQREWLNLLRENGCDISCPEEFDDFDASSIADEEMPF